MSFCLSATCSLPLLPRAVRTLWHLEGTKHLFGWVVFGPAAPLACFRVASVASELEPYAFLLVRSRRRFYLHWLAANAWTTLLQSSVQKCFDPQIGRGPWLGLLMKELWRTDPFRLFRSIDDRRCCRGTRARGRTLPSATQMRNFRANTRFSRCAWPWVRGNTQGCQQLRALGKIW